MKDVLLTQKTQKEQLLAETKEQCKKLEKEIAQFDDKQYQVEIIEKALAAQYAAHRQGFPIDRSIEPEIEQFIATKQLAVRATLNACQNKLTQIDREEKSEERRIKDMYAYKDTSYSSNRYIPYYYTAAERRRVEAEQRRVEREKEKARKEREKNKATALKELGKSCEANRKAAQKNCVDGLKDHFTELDQKAKYFHAKGISRENLLQIVRLMDEVRSEIDKRSTTAQMTLLRKVSQWEVAAKVIPEDIERQDKEKEKTAGSKLQQKLDTAKANAKAAKMALEDAERALSKNKTKLENTKVELARFQDNLPSKSTAICGEAEKLETVRQEQYSKDKKKLEACRDKELQQQKEDIEAADSALQAAEEYHKQLEETKTQLDEECTHTFFLAFGKKKRLKVQIGFICQQIFQSEHELQYWQRQLEALKMESPIARFEESLKKLEDKHDKALQAIAAEKETGLTQLKKTQANLENTIASTEKEICKLEDNITTQKAVLKIEERNISTNTKKLESFHADYLLKTFGKDQFLANYQKQKTAMLAHLTNVAKDLQKEIAALNAELKEIEKTEEVRRKLKEALPEDFYYMDEVKRIYAEVLPGVDPETDNTYNLKSIGFLARKKFALQNWPSLDAYFKHLLLSADTMDLSQMKERFGKLPSWDLVVKELKHEYEILEFEPNQFLSFRKLEKSGITKQMLKAFCDEVYQYLEEDAYFTVRFLNKSGFTSELYDLGFSDYFYAQLLWNDPRFSYCKMLGEIVLHRGKQDVSAQSFILAQIRGAGKIDVVDLVNDLRENFGCDAVTTMTIKQNIRNTEIFYDPILDRLYTNAEWYYSELDEDVEE